MGKKNDLCAAKFVDDQWYRAKIEKIGVSDVQVLYIDYGNRASVPKSKLGSLPATFQTQSGYAKPYSLALTQLPPDEDLTAQAVQGIKEDLLDKTVKDYEDAMARAKKNHLNIWQYGDITQDDAR